MYGLIKMSGRRIFTLSTQDLKKFCHKNKQGTESHNNIKENLKKYSYKLKAFPRYQIIFQRKVINKRNIFKRIFELIDIKESTARGYGLITTVLALIFSFYSFNKTSKHEKERFELEKQAKIEENTKKSIETAVENLMKFTPNRGNLLLPYFSFYEKFEEDLIKSLLLMDTSSVLLLDGASGSGKSNISKSIVEKLKNTYNYKGAVIHVDKMMESNDLSIVTLQEQISNIYRNQDFSFYDVLRKHYELNGVPLIVIIDNIQRVFDSNLKNNYDLNWFISLTMYLDSGLLKVMVVSSEYDVYYSIKTLSNTWFNRVLEYRVPILTENSKELIDYLKSPECQEVFEYENMDEDVIHASKYLGNQLRYYIPLTRVRRGKIDYKSQVDIVLSEYFTVINKSLNNLPKKLKGKEKKLKKIVKYCIPLEGSIHLLKSSYNPRCTYEMEEIKEEELKYLCKIDILKENREHNKVDYYSKLVGRIIQNYNIK